MGIQHKHILILILSLACIATSAQSFEVSGNVTEEKNGLPLTGVNVAVVGNVQGTISDQKGNFLLKTSSSPPFTLQFSFVGFETQIIEVVQANQLINIQMRVEYLLAFAQYPSDSTFQRLVTIVRCFSQPCLPK